MIGYFLLQTNLVCGDCCQINSMLLALRLMEGGDFSGPQSVDVELR